MSKLPLPKLQEEWTHLYKTHLPFLAEARDPIQPSWPVHLDHCFARIILDNAVGISKPWPEVIKAPAVRNMTETQLLAAISLANQIADGSANLENLDARSLVLRNKKGLKRVNGNTEDDKDRKGLKKVKTEDGSISKYFLTRSEQVAKMESHVSHIVQSTSPQHQNLSNSSVIASSYPKPRSPEHKIATFVSNKDPLQLIATSSTLTPFRKRVLALLCEIPSGEYTTYGGLADQISKATGKKTCARAIGSAMRNNPFAPLVPCHRVLAADRKIGGFGGSWGEDGKHAAEKITLLKDEGVLFDGAGKAIKKPWIGWNDTESIELG